MYADDLLMFSPCVAGMQQLVKLTVRQELWYMIW